MIYEDRKYQAELFKIGGFALMTPLGKYIIDLLQAGVINFKINPVISFVASFLLFLLGVIMLQRGFEKLRKDE
jgi:putative Mn2+ efflux pump MntP